MKITTTYTFGGYTHAPILSGKTENTIDPAVTKKTEYAVTVSYDVQRAGIVGDGTDAPQAVAEPAHPVESGDKAKDLPLDLPWATGKSPGEMAFGLTGEPALPWDMADSDQGGAKEDQTSPIVTQSSLAAARDPTG